MRLPKERRRPNCRRPETQVYVVTHEANGELTIWFSGRRMRLCQAVKQRQRLAASPHTAGTFEVARIGGSNG